MNIDRALQKKTIQKYGLDQRTTGRDIIRGVILAHPMVSNKTSWESAIHTVSNGNISLQSARLIAEIHMGGIPMYMWNKNEDWLIKLCEAIKIEKSLDWRVEEVYNKYQCTNAGRVTRLIYQSSMVIREVARKFGITEQDVKDYRAAFLYALKRSGDCDYIIGGVHRKHSEVLLIENSELSGSVLMRLAGMNIAFISEIKEMFKGVSQYDDAFSIIRSHRKYSPDSINDILVQLNKAGHIHLKDI